MQDLPLAAEQQRNEKLLVQKASEQVKLHRENLLIMFTIMV
jgi:hypothetical protein